MVLYLTRVGLLLALSSALSACGSLFYGAADHDMASCQGQGRVGRGGQCVAADAAPAFLPAAALTMPAWDGQLNLPGSPEAQKLDELVTGQPAPPASSAFP